MDPREPLERLISTRSAWPIPIQVAPAGAHGTEALELPPVRRVETVGTVPVDVGVHIVGLLVVLVGEDQVHPAVPVVVGQHRVRGRQRGQFAPSLRCEPLPGVPVDVGRGAAAVGQHQLGKSVPVQVAGPALLGSLGRHFDPRLPNRPPFAPPVENDPIIFVIQSQIQVAVLVQIRQVRPDGIASHPLVPFGTHALRASTVQVDTLVPGIVVDEDQVRVAVPVQVSRRAVGGADGRDDAAPRRIEPPGTVPVDV